MRFEPAPSPTQPRPGNRTIGAWNLIGDGVGGDPAGPILKARWRSTPVHAGLRREAQGALARAEDRGNSICGKWAAGR